MYLSQREIISIGIVLFDRKMPAVEGYEKKFELIRQEVEICKRLASNDVKTRRKGLSVLKKLLNNTEYETSKYSRYLLNIENASFVSI